MTVPGLILASVDAVETYREGLYGPGDPGVTRKVAIGVVLVALLWLGLWAWDRHQKKRRAAAAASAKSLFGELCASHGLSAADRRMLERLASAEGVSPPEAVFTRPEVLHAKCAADAGEPKWAAIFQRVFGDWTPAGA